MLEEIAVDRITDHTEHFPDPQAQMVLASIIARNTRAQLWQIAQPGGTVRFLWDRGNNVFYLSEDKLLEASTTELVYLISTEIKARAIEAGRSYFTVRDLAGWGQETIAGLFQGLTLGQISKRFYSFKNSKVTAGTVPTLAGVEFQAIDTDFLRRDELQNLAYVKDEIKTMWPSLERFGEKGFGVAALLEETVIGWCTAEYASEAQCGIGVATIAEFENKGVATAMATRFVEECLQRQITPYWECNIRNPGSVRVAEKVGFELIQESIFWVGAFQHE
jgi:hypothetical protein